MRLHAGTSGFSYKQWKGPFYPPGTTDADMLRYYASQLSTVEMNNTFYRMPTPSMVERWAEQVPESFRFAIKVTQRISHHARLKDTGELLTYLLHALEPLGARCGPLLVQLPPTFRKDTGRLASFLEDWPAAHRVAFEFRHDSWQDDEVLALLEKHRAALCVADMDEGPLPAVPPTADFGYLRLRRPDYSLEELELWAAELRKKPWQEAYVFFKHEDEGSAPRLALQLRGLFAS